MAKVTSIRLADELAGQLDTLANTLDRPKSWVIEQAIQRYIEDEVWQIEAIAVALNDVRAGTADLVSHEQAMRELREEIAARRQA